jgi:hypothetical protein
MLPVVSTWSVSLLKDEHKQQLKKMVDVYEGEGTRRPIADGC